MAQHRAEEPVREWTLTRLVKVICLISAATMAITIALAFSAIVVAATVQTLF